MQNFIILKLSLTEKGIILFNKPKLKDQTILSVFKLFLSIMYVMEFLVYFFLN